MIEKLTTEQETKIPEYRDKWISIGTCTKKTISVPEGFYALDLVVEYDHFLEESRVVID